MRVSRSSKPSWTSRAFAGAKVNARVPRITSSDSRLCVIDPQAALDVIYQEFLLRRGLGERPRPEEFIRRFPALVGTVDPRSSRWTRRCGRRTAATELSGDRELGQPADRAEASTVVDDDGPDDRRLIRYLSRI